VRGFTRRHFHAHDLAAEVLKAGDEQHLAGSDGIGVAMGLRASSSFSEV
jgi:hypothetical protein